MLAEVLTSLRSFSAADASLVALVAGSFMATSVGVGIFTRWARGTGLLDVPNARSSHETPVPRGAGVVIVVIVTVAMLAGSLRTFEPVVVAAALVVAAISALDDVRSLPSWLRLLVHVACAAAALGSLAPAASTLTTAPGAALGIVWVVALTNIYNFMDGIDGIAGAQGVVSGATIALVSLSAGLPGVAMGGTAISAACGGFLLHNWAPARVFMGDVGSAFLGFVLAGLTLQVAYSSVPLATVAVLSLWPFLFDATFTLARRVARGENLFAAHRSHLYQRLVTAGWSHARVTTLYAVAAVLGTVCGLVWLNLNRAALLLIVPAFAAALWGLVLWRESVMSRDARLAGGRPVVRRGRS